MKHTPIDCHSNSRKGFFVFFQGVGSALAIQSKLTKQTTKRINQGAITERQHVKKQRRQTKESSDETHTFQPDGRK
jgi:hypothetical protein